MEGDKHVEVMMCTGCREHREHEYASEMRGISGTYTVWHCSVCAKLKLRKVEP